MSATAHPERRWFCECMIPGAKEATTFETYGEDAARAMCDVSGWDFLRAWEEGSHSDRPARPEPNRTVSPRQMQALLCEARTTYDIHQKAMGDLASFNEWRADQLECAIQQRSFRAIPARLYNKVKNYFRKLRGAPPVGNPNSHKKQSGEHGDSMEKRESFVFLMAQELGRHARRIDQPATAAEQTQALHAIQKGGAITPAYLVSIAAAKNKGHTIRDMDDFIKLPASRLEQLLFTLVNRIAAREGRGETKKRNKGQK